MKSAVDIFIKRPVLTLVIAISTIIFGLIGYFQMGVDLYPEVEFPVVTITTTLPGASAEVVEQNITKTIEDELGSLSQVESISSTSSFGTSIVVIEFSLSKNIDIAVQEVRDCVAATEHLLPDEIDNPIIQKLNTADQPIQWIAFTTPGDYWEMTQWVDKYAQDSLQKIEGVGSASLSAFQNRSYRIWLDANKMISYGIGALDVIAAVKGEHIELPAGKIEESNRELPIRVLGEFTSSQELSELVLYSKDNKLIRLKDIARVEVGLEDKTSLARFNGLPAVGIAIRKQSGSNAVDVAEKVQQAIPILQENAPVGVKVALAFDSSRFIKTSIEGVQFDLIFGGVLTVLVVYLFLTSARATIITALAIPTSIIATFMLMQSANFTMNNLTMLGLSLAIGMVIDDAIVVIENIYRNLEAGKNRLEATRQAVGEIGFAITVSTLSIIAVFIPIAYMKGIIGKFFFQFGITVSFALIISLIIALTLTPMLSARLISKEEDKAKMPAIKFWIIHSILIIGTIFGLYHFLKEWHSPILVAFFLFLFGLLKDRFEVYFRLFEKGYEKILSVAMNNRIKVLGLCTLFFVFALVLGGSSFVKKEFSRAADEGRFIIQFETPMSASLELTDSLARAVEEKVFSHPEIQSVFLNVGSSKTNAGACFINMVGKSQRKKSQDQVMDELRKELTTIPGIIAFVDRVSIVGGGERRTDLQYVIQGPELHEIDYYVQKIIQRLNDKPHYIDMDSSLKIQKPQLHISIDREKAKHLNLSVQDISATVNAMMGGVDIAYFKEYGDRYSIRMKGDNDYNKDIKNLLRIPVKNRNGKLIELGSVIRVEETVGPVIISHFNKERSSTLYANLIGKPLGEATQEFLDIVREILPENGTYHVSATGNSKAFSESFQYLLQALILAIIIIYLVLAAQFDSFIHPITIMVPLPLALIGVFSGLAISGLSLDIFSFIGIVMLVGIATKNGILLIDCAIQLRASGMSHKEAILKAGPKRLRAVAMTAVTTIAGMIPVALAFSDGGETRASMGMAVMSGMAISTPLTLIVVPIVYSLIEDLRARLKLN